MRTTRSDSPMGVLAEFIQDHAAADDVAATVRALSALTDPAHAEALDTDMHDLTEDDREEAGRLMVYLIDLADALEETAGR